MRLNPASANFFFPALFALSVSIPTQLQAQSFCATTDGGASVGALAENENQSPPGPYYLKIYVYKAGNAAGQHLPTDEQVFESVSILKTDFAAHGIYFVWDCAQIEEVWNDELDALALPPIPDPNAPKPDCVLAQYVAHTDGISVFIGGDQAGYVGVATGIPGLALLVKGSYGYGGVNFVLSRSRVISHEMGHCLGLWHTHHGHEFDEDCTGNPVDPDQCDECNNNGALLESGKIVLHK